MSHSKPLRRRGLRCSGTTVDYDQASGMSASRTRNVTLAPGPIDSSPRGPGGIFVLQSRRQTMRPHSVVALQHREPSNRRGNSDCCKARMTRGGKRPAVVHRSDNGNSGWHLVIEQPPNLLPQDRRNLTVKCIVRPIGGRIDAARQVPFEATCNLQQFRLIRRHHDQ